jgi:elongation factor G
MARSSQSPIIAFAIEPRSRADRARLDSALSQVITEDPELRVGMDRETNQVIVAGMSEKQLEIVATRLSEVGVDAAIGSLRIIYRQMFTQSAKGEGRFVKQTGGRGQYAHATIRLVPREPGSGYVFTNAMQHETIPQRFIAPLEQGIRDALTRHSNAGDLIIDASDVKIELYEGSYHDTDSSEMAFKIAGAMALQDAMAKARLVLMEPIMCLEVVVPSSCSDGVLRDLSKRRAAVGSHESRGNQVVISARIPLSSMLGYEKHLQSCTQGNASCAIRFDRYEPCNVRPDIDDDGRTSGVRMPRTPAPSRNDAAIALPEPDENGT